VFAQLNEVDAAVAVTDATFARQVGWPGLRCYEVPALDPPTVFAAVAADGYDQAALLAGDAPDLPGMLIAKLLRPLTSHPVAAAPALGADRGLLGLSAVLPAPPWLPATDLADLTAQIVRKHAPRAIDVAAGTGWHRLRGPADLARLDPGLEGWDATRALLTGRRSA
jgi:hypothetical protein